MSKPRYREVTISSIVFGVVVGAVMNASITYAGLKIGFTIGGSAIAAVLGFGVLRGLLRRGSILETNIGQTVASAVNVPNSGVIFTVPVLILLGYELSFSNASFWLLTLACVVGAILGSAFIIPVRKQMLDIDRLRFPTGTAVAAILKSPGAGAKKSLVLLSGAALAAVIYAPVAMPALNGPGYGDLNWRLAAPAAARENDPADQLRYERQMRRADRDGDGRPDLVVGSLGSHTLSVLLGKGEGTFSDPIVIPVGRFPHYRVYADFNGDGHLDAAVVSGGEDLVQILLGDGTGRLTLTHSYRVGTNPHGLAGSDFNGDGHLDLVVGNRTSLDAMVLLGDGKGNFARTPPLKIGQDVISVAGEDFDRDGNSDIAVISASSHVVMFFQGDGKGSFRPMTARR